MEGLLKKGCLLRVPKKIHDYFPVLAFWGLCLQHKEAALFIVNLWFLPADFISILFDQRGETCPMFGLAQGQWNPDFLRDPVLPKKRKN